MQRQRVRQGALLVVISLGTALTAGCGGSKEPEANAKGYYEGPMESKASSGKSPGVAQDGGPTTPNSR